jgi:DNA-binding transcriptional LysR family regulator
LIQPRLASFGERYPEITLDITIDNNLSDIVAGGFDAGIRLGYALQRDVIAVPLGPMQRLTVVGSPRYFKRRGTPRTPHELLEHDCIRHRLNRARFFEWEFRIGGGRNDRRARPTCSRRDARGARRRVPGRRASCARSLSSCKR